MKIQYCSDLDLEFPANKRYLTANPLKPEGEILLLAGDIIPFVEIEKEDDFINFSLTTLNILTRFQEIKLENHYILR